ncbi:MAG TPA: CocE/NonD family hydrolase [Candidatus Binataceae bacterium]|nr:CocE/NonD family hydrolase [Candidatus Binataceae bacterium]
MNERPVTIACGDITLEGMYAPGKSTGARAAVVCHPHPLYGGSMHNNVVEAALEALWKLGFATLRFNFRGVGRSGGDHTGGAGEVEDAKAAMAFMLAQPGVAGQGALMAGYSFGAAIAMRAGAEIAQVDTIAAIALPVGMESFDASACANKRIILVAGDSDPYCPSSEIARLAQSIGARAKLTIIEGADHFFGGSEEDVTSALVEMIGR